MNTIFRTEMESIIKTLSDPIPSVSELCDALPFALSYVDRERRYRLVNLVFERYFKRPRVAIIGRYQPDILGPENARKVEPLFLRAFEGHPSVFDHQITVPAGVLEVQGRVIPHTNMRGEVIGVYTVTIEKQLLLSGEL